MVLYLEEGRCLMRDTEKVDLSVNISLYLMTLWLKKEPKWKEVSEDKSLVLQSCSCCLPGKDNKQVIGTKAAGGVQSLSHTPNSGLLLYQPSGGSNVHELTKYW